MATAIKASTAFTQVIAHAESIRNDGAHDLSNMEVGDEWRQGDVAIIRLPESFARKNSKRLTAEKFPSAQLAVGNTQGSRHTLDSLAGVTMHRLADANPLDGPILRLDEPRSILHPEHGDCLNLPAGIYAIQYARAFADELRAVAD